MWDLKSENKSHVHGDPIPETHLCADHTRVSIRHSLTWEAARPFSSTRQRLGTRALTCTCWRVWVAFPLREMSPGRFYAVSSLALYPFRPNIKTDFIATFINPFPMHVSELINYKKFYWMPFISIESESFGRNAPRHVHDSLYA